METSLIFPDSTSDKNLEKLIVRSSVDEVPSMLNKRRITKPIANQIPIFFANEFTVIL